MPDQVESQTLRVATSLAFFIQRANAATDRHRALVGQVDAYLQRCFRSYTTGYNAANAAFERLRRRQALTRDILLGVLFAGIGGAVGGAVGEFVKASALQVTAAEIVNQTMRNCVNGAITDAAKDVGKYVSAARSRVDGRSCL
jgi:hypothetical protein